MCFSCKGCDYNNEMFRRLNNGKTTSLRDRCLQFLASGSCILTPDALRCMPCEILDDLKWYMCAYDLLKFESLFTENGISTSRVWEKHLCHRYRNAFRHYSFGQIFNIEVADSRCHTAQAVYMKLHCSQMLFPVLSSILDKRNSHDVCVQDLMFYIQFTPHLMLTIPRACLLTNEKTLCVLQAIKKHTKHIEFKQRGTLDVSDNILKLIKYFRRKSNVTSFSFSLIRTSCDFDTMLYSELTNEREELQVMEGIRSSISQYSQNFFSDNKCCDNGVRRLSITPDKDLTSMLLEKGMKQLTHLSFHGVGVINQLMMALNEVFRDKYRPPLKFLGFSSVVFHITKSKEKILDLYYAVEEMNIYECEFSDSYSKSGLLMFIQRNKHLIKLNMLATDISNNMEQNHYWKEISSNSDLQSLTTPVDKYLQHSFHSMLDLSRNLTFLQIQWHPLWNDDIIREALSVLKSLNHLQTLVLRNNAIRGFFPDVISSIFIHGEYPMLRCFDMSGCHVKGNELISVAKSIWKTRGKHGRKLVVLDMSMNVLTRQQQEEINMLYKDLTEILLVEIADRPHAFTDV